MSRATSAFTFLSVLLLLPLSGSFAGEAPSIGFRGNGSGRYSDATPPTEWDSKKNVKWTAEVGKGYSSPIVVGDKIIVTSEPDQVVCVNLADGKIAWKAAPPVSELPPDAVASIKKRTGGTNLAGFAAATPASDGENIYAIFGPGIVVTYGLDGKRKWLKFFEPAAGTFGHSASPRVADGKVFVNLSHLIALDAATGTVAWEAPDVGNTYGTNVLTKLSGTRVLITPMGQVVRAADGKLLSAEIVKGLGGEEYSISPIVDDGIVYYIDEKSFAVKLTLEGDAIKSDVVWKQNTAEPAFGSPVLKDGLIYACGKGANYTILDAKTGAKVLEKVLDLPPANGTVEDHDKAIVYPSVTLAGPALFLSNDYGDTFVLAAQKDYKELARNALPEGSGASPAFAGGNMILRAGNLLYCIGK